MSRKRCGGCWEDRPNEDYWTGGRLFEFCIACRRKVVCARCGESKEPEEYGPTSSPTCGDCTCCVVCGEGRAYSVDENGVKTWRSDCFACDQEFPHR